MLKINDKIQVKYQSEYSKIDIKWKSGRIAAITKHLIVVQHKNYKESYRIIDILAHGWLHMKYWNSNEWVNVDKKVIGW